LTPDAFTEALGRFRQQCDATQERFVLTNETIWPILNEDTGQTSFDRHYTYHPAWACRVLRRTNPPLHYDFSSTLNFVAMASAWVPITFCDYRPAPLQLEGLCTRREDLTHLSFPDNSLESVSCMHVLEHIGLGRYGDALDYDGDLKAVAELIRVVRGGGNLLIVLPLGRAARVQFNAHRIYTWEGVLEMFRDQFDLVESALIPEQANLGLVYSPDTALLNEQNYACGCFWFRKR
jgi:SAM-dependent methyltransferase